MLNLEMKITPVFENETNLIEVGFVNTFKVDYFYCDYKVAENYLQVVNTTSIVEILFESVIDPVPRPYLFGVDVKTIIKGFFTNSVYVEACLDALIYRKDGPLLFQELLKFTGQEVIALGITDGDKKTIAVIHPIQIEEAFPKYSNEIKNRAINAITVLLQSDNNIDNVVEIDEEIYSLYV